MLGDSKQYLVRSRLSPLVNRFSLSLTFPLLQNVIAGRNRELRIAAVDAMTTNETLWFRDGYPFTVFNEKILPELAAKKRPIKIWSAAKLFRTRAVFDGNDSIRNTISVQVLTFHSDHGNRLPDHVRNLSCWRV